MRQLCAASNPRLGVADEHYSRRQPLACVRKSEIVKGLYVSGEDAVIVKSDISRREPIANECRCRCGAVVHESGICVALYVDAERKIPHILIDRDVQLGPILLVTANVVPK
jgi:hypothetical protein